jgi:hypothetical protein
MSKKLVLALVVLVTVNTATSVFAENGPKGDSSSSKLIQPQIKGISNRVLVDLDRDAPIPPNQYVKVDIEGGVTKSTCPYTCEDRGLAKEYCKIWESVLDPNECYVQDIRIPSDAIPLM